LPREKPGKAAALTVFSEDTVALGQVAADAAEDGLVFSASTIPL